MKMTIYGFMILVICEAVMFIRKGEGSPLQNTGMNYIAEKHFDMRNGISRPSAFEYDQKSRRYTGHNDNPVYSELLGIPGVPGSHFLQLLLGLGR